MSKSRPGRAALAWCLAPLAVALAACAPEPYPVPGAPAPPGVTDANISSVAQNFNTGEIRLEEFAATRSTNASVKAFAQTMARDHSESNSRLGGILSSQQIQPAPSAASTEIQQSESNALASLQSRSGADFDRTYMDAEINHHRWVINQLDSSLIPGARDSSLKNYLMGVRSTEAAHLQEAERIRATLGGS